MKEKSLSQPQIASPHVVDRGGDVRLGAGGFSLSRWNEVGRWIEHGSWWQPYRQGRAAQDVGQPVAAGNLGRELGARAQPKR
jgi:hypothetical protein